MIPGEAQELELLVKDVTSTVLNVFDELKETMDKELKEISKMMSEQNENISKEREIIKSNQKQKFWSWTSQ